MQRDGRGGSVELSSFQSFCPSGTPPQLITCIGQVIITAVGRKRVTIANALCKSRQKWAAPTT